MKRPKVTIRKNPSQKRSSRRKATPTTGASLIANERMRQIKGEGYYAEDDDSQLDGELAMAAACYAAPEPVFRLQGSGAYVDPWPWDFQVDKRRDDDGEPVPATTMSPERRLDLLVKAGALIAAEIDRQLRIRGSKSVGARK